MITITTVIIVMGTIVFKTATLPLLKITDTSIFLIIFSNYFNLLIMNIFHVKLNHCQHGFTRSKFTIINFVKSWFYQPLVGPQLQADIIYFDFRSTSDLIPHTLLPHNLSLFGLGGYVNWFRRYLTNRQSQLCVSETLSWFLKYSLVSLMGLFWGLCFSARLLITNVMQLPTVAIYVLLTISKPIVIVHLRMTALYHSLIYKLVALITIWNSAWVKLKIRPSQGKLTYWCMSTNFVNPL
jgi:hypothetical protein